MTHTFWVCRCNDFLEYSLRKRLSNNLRSCPVTAYYSVFRFSSIFLDEKNLHRKTCSLSSSQSPQNGKDKKESTLMIPLETRSAFCRWRICAKCGLLKGAQPSIAVKLGAKLAQQWTSRNSTCVHSFFFLYLKIVSLFTKMSFVPLNF